MVFRQGRTLHELTPLPRYR